MQFGKLSVREPLHSYLTNTNISTTREIDQLGMCSSISNNNKQNKTKTNHNNNNKKTQLAMA